LNNLFYRFWPELFELGVIHIFRTPLIKVFQKNKKDLWFYTEREFKDWEATEGQKIRSWTFKYFKGLGTSTSKEFAEYLSDLDTHLVRISIETNEDRDMLDLAFNGQRADDRKAWLETGAEVFEF
jgi:DNA topoisomerase-2